MMMWLLLFKCWLATPKFVWLKGYLYGCYTMKFRSQWSESIQNTSSFKYLITPHAQRERGKVIGRGVHIYIYLWSKKKFESYFRDRLTFSNVDSRTSRRIYRLALLLRAPETLSSLSKSRISIFNAHLTLLVRKMTSHNSIGKYRHLVN